MFGPVIMVYVCLRTSQIVFEKHLNKSESIKFMLHVFSTPIESFIVSIVVYNTTVVLS